MADYKIILYGDYGVGKTSLTMRLLKNTFDDNYQSTIGASFLAWRPESIGTEINTKSFGLWDTAGQERFSNLLPMYLRNADAVLYCWDRTVLFSETQARNKYNIAKEYSANCYFYLVMTKIDLTTDFYRCKDAELWAKEMELNGVYYTSAFNGEGVLELFNDMANKIVTTPIIANPPDTIKINTERECSKTCCQ